MEADCLGQLHGHDFPHTGANCTKCGVNQRVLSGEAPRKPRDLGIGAILARRPAITEQKPVRGIHSEMHALVNDVRHRFGETAKKGKGSFGFYIGYFNRLGMDRVRMFLAETKDGNNPKKLFWWKIGQYFKAKKSGTPHV